MLGLVTSAATCSLATLDEAGWITKFADMGLLVGSFSSTPRGFEWTARMRVLAAMVCSSSSA